ncbi:hemoglobin [Microbacteriaceae bacterium SG_E_30_P1]|uniref:Group 1 truncated hemoglobin n=1 Tax=Antiquaquibacter oligotrophicus TaxID=2880260 RepID=A0ABT6KL95_9MICO|nr:group 1 truncated hemoglobin [Antiquaquibacter oligotrophicus]MDH6179877.1 hemoglobin [Antiquaquibacter oligotrophicus]UDF14362.1 group 1 truncated hemoglobin [Antiquaquibacter oligotrophicus]
MNLYEQLGGDPAIAVAVESFYSRVLADPELARYFEGMDVSAIKRHQRDFFSVLLDGPEIYDGRSMRNAHSGLGITEAEYTRVLRHLRDTLDDLRVEPELADGVIRRIELLRAAIVEIR